MSERDQLAALQAENVRLIALLENNGIEWRLPPEPTPTASAPPVPEPEPSRLSTTEKVALFRRLFRGRTDAYPIRWESKTTGKSGYAPACGNEWLAGVCEKPRIKCGECNNRLLIPLSDQVIYEHLAGKRTVRVYPLLIDERYAGVQLDVAFASTLGLDQELAVAAILHHDAGVLCVPTAFGKTNTAAAMIARRSVNTLVLVDRTELLKQWQECLQSCRCPRSLAQTNVRLQ